MHLLTFFIIKSVLDFIEEKEALNEYQKTIKTDIDEAVVNRLLELNQKKGG